MYNPQHACLTRPNTHFKLRYMPGPTTKLTYQDYILLPEDGKRYEIVDGDLYMTPAPLTRHQVLVGCLLHLFMTYLEAHPIGAVFCAPCDVVLSDVDVVQPDLLLVLNPGKASITEKNVQGAPDLIIEILSPSTAVRDRALKRKRYEYFGVHEYWLVDPAANTIEILSLKDTTFFQAGQGTAQTTVSSPLLPDLTLDLAKLFA